MDGVRLATAAFGPNQGSIRHLDPIRIIVNQRTSASRDRNCYECSAEVIDRCQRNEKLLVTLFATVATIVDHDRREVSALARGTTSSRTNCDSTLLADVVGLLGEDRITVRIRDEVWRLIRTQRERAKLVRYRPGGRLVTK